MSEANSKANEVVRVLRGELDRPGGPAREPEDRAAFAALVERLRREARERLTRLTAADPESKVASGERVAIYFYSCGLAAMGRADALVDVFDYWPLTSRGSVLWRLAAWVTEGLPLPRRSDSMPDAAGAKQWVDAHVSELMWDERSGRFVTRDPSLRSG
jgi:hypothetical protein